MNGELGESGSMGNKPKNGWCDSLMVKDIDFQSMFTESVEEANKTYDQLESIVKGRSLPSWREIVKKHGEDYHAAREEYNGTDVMKDLNAASFHVWDDLVETFGNSREEYVEKCKDATVVPYAVVKDGQWYQKGEMGWFGMNSDEISQDEWNSQFWEMINSLPPETKLTLVDCHI